MGTPTHRSFRDIDAWRAAGRLVRPVYNFTSKFPAHELYCLTQQMRRAVHSAHPNIAEGSGRLSNGEWQQFLGQARGSLLEIESDVIAAFDLMYCTQTEAAELTKLIKKALQILNGLLRSTTRGFKNKKFKPAPVNG